MKLEYTLQGTIRKYIVQGKVEVYQKDLALASVLKRIADGGSISALGDLGVFSAGLKDSFESEKLTFDGRITDKGRAIAVSGYNWKGLSGRFVFEILTLDGEVFLLNCTEYNGQDITLFEDNAEQLPLSGEYKTGDCKGYRVERIDPYKQAESTPTQVNVDISYDYENDITVYAIAERGISFNETENFSHIDFDTACDILSEVLENYELRNDKDEIFIDEYDGRANPLLKGTIASLYDKRGQIEVQNDGYKVKDIRLIVERVEVADELLYEYLMQAAGKCYLGYSEVASLISEFYGFFKRCEYISKNTSGVYAEILERSSTENKKAFMRLQACRDIVPDIVGSAFQLEYKDFTNQRCSLDDIVLAIVGRGANVASVEVITKYAYKNASISRALMLLADALKTQYNSSLTVITAKDSFYQAETARIFYERLERHKNINFTAKNKKDIEQIHDRYYRITHEDGYAEWVILTGELDAVRFENDFADGKNAREDITHTTKGFVKEMRIIRVKESSIPENVKAVMAEV